MTRYPTEKNVKVIGLRPPKIQGKHLLITSNNFCNCWPIAQAAPKHKGNFVRRFIGQEIIKKFGYSKLILIGLWQRINFSGN